MRQATQLRTGACRDRRHAELTPACPVAQERIVYASQGIAENAMGKVKDGDVILTFGRLELATIECFICIR